MLASLIETCKLRQTYFANVIRCIVLGHPQNEIDELPTWGYRPEPPARA